MEPEKQYNQSKITLKFGDDITQTNAFRLNFNLHLVSDKHKNIRFNISEFLGIDIPQNSIVVEFETKEEGADAAEKLNEVAKQSQSFKELTEEKEANIRILGKGTKAFVIISGEAMDKQLEGFNQLKSNWELETGLDNALKIEVSSNNNLQQMKQLIINQHKLRALLDSLKVDINFKRTSATNLFLESILSQAFMHSPLGPETILKSFDNFSLEVKCQSSKFLEGNPAYDMFLEKTQKVNLNEKFKEIRHIFGNQMKLHLFNEGVSADMSIVDEHLQFILDLLLA